MHPAKLAFSLAAYLGMGCTVAIAQHYPGREGMPPARWDVKVVSETLVLRAHDRYERETLRCNGRKVGHISALFTDADGRTGTVRLAVHNDSDCRLALHVYARAEGSREEYDRETEYLEVYPNRRQEFTLRVALPRHSHDWDRSHGRRFHRHRDRGDVTVLVTVRGEMHCHSRRPH